MKYIVFILFFTVGCQATKLGKTPKAKPGNLKSRKGKNARHGQKGTRTAKSSMDKAAPNSGQARVVNRTGEKKTVTFTYQGESFTIEGQRSWPMKEWKKKIAATNPDGRFTSGWRKLEVGS